MNVIRSDVISLSLKRDRPRIGLLFYVKHLTKIVWTGCELISELTSWQCNWKGNQKGKGTDETPQRWVIVLFSYQNISFALEVMIIMIISKFMVPQYV